jgi:hypothetical protein
MEQFEDAIQKDLAWRKMEISQLFRILSDVEAKDVVTKSMVLLLYAHWEGFIKKSCKYYLKYIGEKKVKIKDLTINFKAIVLKGFALECIDNDGLNLAKEIKFMNKQDKMDDKNFKISVDVDNDLDEDIINTKHNLNSKVLQNISDIIGVKYNDAMKTRSNYIDSILLKHRNSIGHAGKMALDSAKREEILEFDEVVKLKDFVLVMLDYYAKTLLDYTEQELYLQSNNAKRDTYELDKEQELTAKLEMIERKKDTLI